MIFCYFLDETTSVPHNIVTISLFCSEKRQFEQNSIASNCSCAIVWILSYSESFPLCLYQASILCTWKHNTLCVYSWFCFCFSIFCSLYLLSNFFYSWIDAVENFPVYYVWLPATSFNASEFYCRETSQTPCCRTSEWNPQ